MASDLIWAAADATDALEREFAALGMEAREVDEGLFALPEPEEGGRRALPRFVFSRQVLPGATELHAESIRAFARAIVDAIVGVFPDGAPWSLHVVPFEPVPRGASLGARASHRRVRSERPSEAETRKGRVPAARCSFIEEAVVDLLGERRRHLLRARRTETRHFKSDESVVQLLLVEPERGFLSVAKAPWPYEHRHQLSFFPGGKAPVAVDKRPPSRAFAKLIEAEERMGRHIAVGDTVVDLGAAPGSWTFVAVERGARVVSVDRSELRADLLAHPHVRFVRGDAFRFEPEATVDWLICDVIARAERSAELLLKWLRRGNCRHFVVTLKVDDEAPGTLLQGLASDLAELSSDYWLQKLTANKKEVCAFGTARSVREDARR